MAGKSHWPVLKCYDQDHLRRIAMPLGGIGTGTVSLGGRGDLRDWEIMNRPAKGYAPGYENGAVTPFFALWAKASGKAPVTRCLEGVLDENDYEGAAGCVQPNHGMPRFRQCHFEAAYPLAQVHLADPAVPLDVRLEAFNPLIPADVDASSIPMAVLRYVLINRSAKPVKAAVCGSLPNFIGDDGTTTLAKDNVNTFRDRDGLKGIYFASKGVCECAETYGTMALATTAKNVTYWTDWKKSTQFWRANYLAFWDDFSDDGKLERTRPFGSQRPYGFVSASVTVPPRSQRAVTFLVGWHFPNRVTWTKFGEDETPSAGCCGGDPNVVGNYYTTQYNDAWDVLKQAAPALGKLEARTVGFVEAFCRSDLPATVKEAALFNLSTLRSQTCFRTPDGLFHGWEGCNDREGCCYGTCTHVWNYEQATAFLFGDLSRKLRILEFEHGLHDNGMMNFRIGLPLADKAHAYPLAAADGQMGCIMKMYRDWQLSGDDEWLRRLWPQVKKALAFAWVKHGWDGDQDGVMEGCQHNTMDVEYFGPNGQMAGWYLGALRAGQEMATYLGDDAFADKCATLFANGSKWVDANLFNGQFYEHQIRPPKSLKHVADGLRSIMGSESVTKPDFQLGKACLVDQLVGQYMAHICGLGYLLKPANVRKSLLCIYRHNFLKSFSNHFNNMRSFVLNDERATLMASYPSGNRPEFPFPYFTEVMTGFEYTAAIGLLQEGEIAKGLEMIAAVRDRYDGKRRNPFDEAECGHHYARAMATWAAVLELTGFHYSGVDEGMLFRPVERGKATNVWSTGDAYGTAEQKRSGNRITLTLTVLGGQVALKQIGLLDWALTDLPRRRVLTAGKTLTITLTQEAGV